MIDKIVKSSTRNLRVSPRKLNLQAKVIRGMPVDKALKALSFSKKRIAKDVYKTLSSAIANAENNCGFDIDRLIVKEAYVSNGFSIKRYSARAKGRGTSIKKPFSHLTIKVQESES